MSLRALVLALAVPLVGFAQLQVYVVENGVERAAPGLLDVGSVQVGENLDTKFRIRNTGATAITLQTLIVAGTGFRATGYPALPYIVAADPKANVDFTIRFSPQNYGSYSASLSVNSTSVLLRAVSSAGALLSSNGASLIAGGTVDFGLVERGTTSTRRFTLKNTTSVRVPVDAISVTGGAFRGPSGITAPLELAPGAEAPFDITFEPPASGIAQGTLRIDSRTFNLTGSSSEPAFPRPTIVLEPGAAAGAKQAKVSVRFPNASRAVGDGVLRLEFEASKGSDDPAIVFVANSARTLAFHVAEGSTEASFGGASTAVFQTGTTAGKMTLTAEVGGYKEQFIFYVGITAVQIDSATAVRNGVNLEVQIAGYDNTRTMGKMAFTFFDASGQRIGPGPIPVDAVDPVARYFSESQLGGVFSLRAVFPVTGNAAAVAAVEVSLENSAGTNTTQRLRF